MTDGHGKVLPEMQQCLDVMAKYDMVMATGHIAPAELEPVIKAAKEAGVQRIIITHPEFPTTHLTVDDQKNLQQYGVYFERVFTTPHTDKCTWEETLNNIKRGRPVQHDRARRTWVRRRTRACRKASRSSSTSCSTTASARRRSRR